MQRQVESIPRCQKRERKSVRVRGTNSRWQCWPVVLSSCVLACCSVLLYSVDKKWLLWGRKAKKTSKKKWARTCMCSLCCSVASPPLGLGCVPCCSEMVSSPTMMAFSSPCAGRFLGCFGGCGELSLLPSHRVAARLVSLPQQFCLSSFGCWWYVCTWEQSLGTLMWNPCCCCSVDFLAGKEAALGGVAAEWRQQIHSWVPWQKRLVEVLIKSISGLGKVADGVIKYSYSL